MRAWGRASLGLSEAHRRRSEFQHATGVFSEILRTSLEALTHPLRGNRTARPRSTLDLGNKSSASNDSGLRLKGPCVATAVLL